MNTKTALKLDGNKNFHILEIAKKKDKQRTTKHYTEKNIVQHEPH